MAVDFKDYYKTLGISKDADQKAIRQAYRKLARKYHPDVNPGDKKAEEQFKEVNEANEVLSDSEKRKKYDEMLNYHQRTGHWPGSTGTEAGGSPYGDFRGGNYQYRTVTEEDLEDLFGGQQSPFSDFFETFFRSNFGQQRPTGRSRTRGRPGATLGEDIESPVEITLAEAYQGATRMLEVSEPNGSKRRLEVKIPAGIDEGARIRMAGQGVQGIAGRGNLYLRVHIKPDHRFSRDGTTLRITIEVPLAQAVLGGETRVPTPDGRNLMLHIPEETANGKAFRLRGQGMPHVGKPDQRGDLYAKVSVVLPTHLNEEQRRLFEAFARSTGYTG